MLLRNFRFADVFLGAPQICFEPDGGDGSGAGGSGGGTAVDDAEGSDADEDDKKFSQKDLDEYLQKRLARSQKELKQELKKKEQAQQDLLKKFEELEKKFRTLGDGKDDGAGDSGNIDLKTIQGKLEKQQERHNLELSQLKSKVEEAEKGRQAAIEKQRLVERDTEIRQALIAAGCLPTAMVAAERYFIPSVYWDEDDLAWLFKTQGDNQLTIAEGIAAELPPYFKAAAIVGGGSGTTSSKDKKKVELQNNLKDAEAKLAKLSDAMKQSFNEPRIMAEWMAQEKAVKKLRAELASK